MEKFEYNRLRIEVTGQCNFQCKYCFNSVYNDKSKIEKEISVKEIKKLIDDASEMKIKNYYIIGGEPLIHPQIFEIFDHIKKKGGFVSLSTNGSLLTNSMIGKLKNIPLANIAISLDGFEGHDKVRFPSNHKKIIETIKRVKKNLTDNIHIISVINEISRKDVLRLYDVLKEIGIQMWDLNHMFNEGRGKEYINELEIKDYNSLVYSYIDLLKKYFKDGKPFNLSIHNVYNSMILEEGYDTFDSLSHPCSYYLGIIPVKPSGDVVLCPNFTEINANFRDNNDLLTTLAKRNVNDFFNIKIVDLDECKECRYLKICGGGCRGDAVKFMGDVKAPDPVSCLFMPLIEKHIFPILPTKEKENYENLILKNKSYPRLIGKNVSEAITSVAK